MNSRPSVPLPASLWPAVYRSVGGASWPPQEPEEATAFVRSCAAHGLLSLLLQADDVRELVRPALDSMRALDRANRERTRILLDAFGRLAAILEGEPFLVLKGLDYAFRLYREPHLRQMSDIDILIPRSRTAAIARRLEEAGLQRTYPAGAVSRLSSHHEMVFKLGDVTVEPHHSFIQRQRHAIGYDEVWEGRTPCRVGHISAWRLNDEHAILYGALSLAIKEFDVPLIRYLDLFFLLDSYPGDLLSLVGLARRWRMERAYFAALDRTVLVFPELGERLQPSLDRLLTPRRRQFLRDRVLPDPLSRQRPTRSQQLWRKFQLMDGYRERIRFPAYQVLAIVAGRATILAGRSSLKAGEKRRHRTS